VPTVSFHFNVAEPALYACRLLRKAVASGVSVRVCGAMNAQLDEIDQLLWTAFPLEFIAHCRADADALVLVRSPIVIERGPVPGGQEGALINLGSMEIAHFSPFERIIEIVDTSEAGRLAARGRWRFYKEAGWTIETRDTSTTATPTSNAIPQGGDA
jgi:DNA polymerase III subunit chi